MYHPKVNKTSQAHERTVRLNQAYEVLRDPAKCADYDRRRNSDSQSGRRYQQQQDAQAERERKDRAERERQRREQAAQAERERREYQDWEWPSQARVRGSAEQERREQASLPFQAVGNRNAKLVRNLISAGTDVNARDDGHRTPLHYAEDMEQAEVASTIRENGGAL